MSNTKPNENKAIRQIAMWNCPRSRSTAITRAFEQLDRCTVFDTPFYGAYLEVKGISSREHQHPRIEEGWDKDVATIIAKMTEPLPEGQYAFQRHISRTVLPEFGRDWLGSLNNFFLIRHPKDILISYRKVLDRYGETRDVRFEDIGIDLLCGLFEHAAEINGQLPIVIHSDDLAREPARVLSYLCGELGLPFSETMLSWESDLSGSALGGGASDVGGKKWSDTWYVNVAKSNGFNRFEKKDVPLSEELKPLLDQCMPYYEKLEAHRWR